MKLEDVFSLFSICLSEMPKAYPKPRLVMHESSEAMVDYIGDRHDFVATNKYSAALVAGMAEADKNAVHVPLNEVITKDVMDVLDTLCHEIGHLFYAQKFGPDSKEHFDEPKAKKFANRWKKKIAKKLKIEGDHFEIL